MGRFSYKCPEHGEFSVSLEKRERVFPCPKCQTSSRPLLRPGSMQMVERLDNGLMPRAVERLHNIEEIMEEREKKFRRKDDDEGE